MHCENEIKIVPTENSSYFSLTHNCTKTSYRSAQGYRKELTSNLLRKHTWCPAKEECNSCIQIVPKNYSKVRIGKVMRE
jgi:hypothetical protein